MAIKTSIQPRQNEEAFTNKDLTEITLIIQNTHRIYTEQLLSSQFTLHSAEREVNRASHEQQRLERHLARIDDFCKKHNIKLDYEREK